MGFADSFNAASNAVGGGISDALSQRQQQFKEQMVAQQQTQTEIDNTLNLVAQITRMAAGKDPNAIAKTVNPLIDSAVTLAASHLGPDAANLVQQKARGLLAAYTPGSPAVAAGQVAPTATPAPVTSAPLPPAQPQLSQSEVITPSQVTAANQQTPNQRVQQAFDATAPNENPQPASMVVADNTTKPDVTKSASPEKDAEDLINYTHLVPLPEAVGKLSPRAVRSLAIQSALGNNSGLVRQPAIVRQAVQSDAADINTALRRSGVDVNMTQADYKANTAALTQLAKQTAAINAFEKNAIYNGAALVDLAKKVDATGVPVVERWIRNGRQALGDPDVAEFMFQMRTFRTEVAKITTNANLSGVLTDEARKEVEEGLPNSSSLSQIVRIVNRAESDFNNRKRALAEEADAIQRRFGFSAPLAERSAPSAVSSSPTQQQQTTKDNKYFKDKYGLK